MHQSKFIQLLKTMNAAEFRRFRKMLQSPFFTTNINLLAFYDTIKAYYPSFESSKLSKEKIFKKIFPERRYDDNKMRALLKEMTRLVEDCFLNFDLRQSPYHRQKRLVNIYGKRELYPFFKKGIHYLIKELNTKPYRDLEYYKEVADLNLSYYFHPLTNPYDISNNALEESIDSMDHYFALYKLRYGNELRNQARIVKKSYKLRFMEAIEVESDLFESSVLIKLYRYLAKVFEEEKTESFKQLEKLYFPNIESISTEDRQLIFFYSLNFINRQVNLGYSEYSKKALEWYRYGLVDGLLIQKGRISEITFGNIVTYGCREKDFKWTKKFIEEYGEKLNSSNQEEVVQFNLGLVHFYNHELDKSFTILNKYNFPQSLQLRVRFTSIRVLFMQFLKDHTYYGSFFSYAKATQKYMDRTNFFSKAVLEPHKNTIGILISLSKKIIKFEAPSSIQQWFTKKLEANDKLVVKGWLEEIVKNI